MDLDARGSHASRFTTTRHLENRGEMGKQSSRGESQDIEGVGTPRGGSQNIESKIKNEQSNQDLPGIRPMDHER